MVHMESLLSREPRWVRKVVRSPITSQFPGGPEGVGRPLYPSPGGAGDTSP